MSPDWQIEDSTVEAIVRGDVDDEQYAPLVVFARRLADMGDAAPPVPSAQLAALLDGDERPTLVPSSGHHPPAELASVAAPVDGPLVAAEQARRSKRRQRMPVLETVVAKAAGLGMAAKIGLGASAAVTGVTTAGAAGALPGPATDAVRGTIEAVTPVDFSDGSTEADVDSNVGVDAANGTAQAEVDGPADAQVGADASGAEADVDTGVGSAEAEVDTDDLEVGVDVDADGNPIEVPELPDPAVVVEGLPQAVQDELRRLSPGTLDEIRSLPPETLAQLRALPPAALAQLLSLPDAQLLDAIAQLQELPAGELPDVLDEAPDLPLPSGSADGSGNADGVGGLSIGD